MAITRTLPEKDSAEGYESQFDRNSDAADVRGIYVQNDSSNDSNVLLTRDASNNMTFADGVVSGTKTLTQLLDKVTANEFLLDNEPVAETGANDAQYSLTYTGGKVSNETWKRNDNTNVKTIDYTYTGTKLTSEVRKVYAADGSTIVAQVTWTYSYTGSNLSSGIMVRNV